ncbi:hypothetical protein LY76DRAFT_650252 [Colletotrichum caudatum]|nr:hypothetical protein LY76DRAFT_650252 [Colletotrichum caudatum]
MPFWTPLGAIASSLSFVASAASAFLQWFLAQAGTTKWVSGVLDDWRKRSLAPGVINQYVQVLMKAKMGQSPSAETLGAFLEGLTNELRRSNDVSQEILIEVRGMRTDLARVPESLTEVNTSMTGMRDKLPEPDQLLGLFLQALEEERKKAKPSCFGADVAVG